MVEKDQRMQLSRRELGRIALGGALGATLMGSPQSGSAALRPQPPGIKLGSPAPANPTDEDLLFYKQLGVDCVYCAVTPEFNSVEGLLSIKKRYADAGLAVHNVRNLAVTNNQVDIVLNRPGRDRRIEDYKIWLRTVGKAGFHYTLSNFNMAQIVLSGLAEMRGSKTRDFDLSSPTLGLPAENASGMTVMGSANSPVFGRAYSPDEIWANYTHFIRQVAPVAEEEGVAIGFHPDDPPVPSLFGVPRILSTFDDCRKALKIANSPNVGMCLCCGTWAEGGVAMGIDPAGAIRHFGPQKQIYEIHFRNVSSPLPHFHETSVDNGYYDMYKVMKALVDVKYDGIVHLDHFVPMVGGNRTYEAFTMGYMKAMLQRARAGHTA
ncbi:MAG: mannonate dehydratase [Bryobacteraceae bacterium]